MTAHSHSSRRRGRIGVVLGSLTVLAITVSLTGCGIPSDAKARP